MTLLLITPILLNSNRMLNTSDILINNFLMKLYANLFSVLNHHFFSEFQKSELYFRIIFQKSEFQKSIRLILKVNNDNESSMLNCLLLQF